MPNVPTGAAIPRACLDLVKHFEGQYLTAYRCPAGVPTIGYGHTAGVRLGQTIDVSEATTLLIDDLSEAAANVDRLVHVPLSSNERGALASFVFNLGAGSLASSTLLRLLNQGDRAGAAAEFSKWVWATVNGERKKLPGLVARRAAEETLFRTVDGALQVLPTGQHHPQPQMVAAPAGADDDRVRRIQRVLGVAVDGVYGPATRAAVARWQAAHGLTVDGVVGPITAAKMGWGDQIQHGHG